MKKRPYKDDIKMKIAKKIQKAVGKILTTTAEIKIRFNTIEGKTIIRIRLRTYSAQGA
jgi:hypothetical protein